jgi:predicted secreted hydrolase
VTRSRAILTLLALAALWLSLRADARVTYPPVVEGTTLEFPRDEGSHPDYKLEWWYVTGWLEPNEAARKPLGFQVTFFRVRTGLGEDNPSRFAPRQVLFAHAALADPVDGKLRHAQRSAREGFGLAYARQGLVDVRLDDWSLAPAPEGGHVATVRGDEFEFRLELRPTQAPMLQGNRGFSRKGPDPRAASYYYSLPQLAVSGEIVVDGRARRVHGRAWFDHEWSSDYVDERALGWDWLGINLHDGGALMAFRMRDSQGGARWASATLRAPSPTTVGEGRGERRTFAPSPDLRSTSPAEAGEVQAGEVPAPSPAVAGEVPARSPMRVGEGWGEGRKSSEPSPALRATSPAGAGEVQAGEVRTFEPHEVQWSPLAEWRSSRTGIRYPVRWRVRVGDAIYRVEPMLDDAELDSRASTGILYWEGPVRLLDDVSGKELGRGYLELTGYGGKVDL